MSTWAAWTGEPHWARTNHIAAGSRMPARPVALAAFMWSLLRRSGCGDRVLAHVLARAFDPVVLHLEPLLGLLAEALGVMRRGLRDAVDGVMRGAAGALD